MGTVSIKLSRFAFSSIGALAVSVVSIPAHAQDAGAVQLPTIVVAPTTIPTPLSEIGSSVTVITGEELQRDQQRTIPDALAVVPGLNLVQNGGPGGSTSVFIRGTNPNHTKVLIDGIDVSDPSNRARIFDLGQLLTSDVERIEVLRGPQSGLYGADAVGGVIAIYTKKGSGPAKVIGTLEGGSFGTFNQTAQVSGSTADTNYALTASHFRAASTPVTPAELLPPGRKAIDNFYDNSTVSTRLGHDFSEDFGVSFVGRYTDAKLKYTADEFPPFPAPPVPAAEQSIQVSHQFYTRGEATWSLWDKRFKNTLGLAYTDAWRWNNDPNFQPPSTDHGQRVTADWRGYLTVVPGQTLVMGLEDETEQLRIRQFDTLKAKNSNKAGYLELQSTFAERFFLTSNVRHDINDRFGGATTWRVAPALLIPFTNTKLKASYGTGFKAPTLSQLFEDFPPFFVANRNLKPEQSAGYDFGFEQPIANDRLRFGVTWFHNNITNLINFTPDFSSNENIGHVTTKGEEVFVSVDLTPDVKMRADYTHTIAINDVTGEELVRRPRHKASLNVAWTGIDKLTTSATILYVSSWKDVDRFGLAPAPFSTTPYTLVNLAANYTIDEHAAVFARVDNLFNKHYQDPVGFERPGLGAYAGFRLTN